MKRWIKSGLLALAILLSLCSPLGGPVQQARAEEAETTSGTWGENLTWEIKDDTLYINGTGPMLEGLEGEDVPVPVSLSDGEDYDPSIEHKNLVYPWSDADFDTVVIGEGVTSIAPKAFSGYSDSDSDSDTPVTFSVSLPASLVSIGDYAFDRSGNVAIGAFTLPSGLTSFGYCVFGDTPVWGLQVAEGNTAFSVEGDVLFNHDRTELILYPNTPITFQDDTYTVPDTVKSIRGYAFAGCDLLSVTVPEGVTTIGEGAFSSAALRVITLPDSVTSIGAGAFQYNSRLTSLTLPDSLVAVADGLCYDCSQLESVTLPSGITSIGEDAFSYCEALKSITLPDSLTDIGESAFAYSGLTSLTLPGSLTTVADDLCAYCDALESVTLLDGITSIGDDAFYYCDALKSVTLPNSLTTIGDSAFFQCEALTSIQLPDNVTTIGDYAFCYCTKLPAINIPNRVTEIGEHAFYSCKALKNIELPGSVTTIGDHAFAKCASLATANIPNGLKTIPDGIFSDCNKLTEITISSGVTTIGNSAFADCYSLTEIEIPDGVTEIGSRAFMNCVNLAEVEIPNGVTTIGGAAFAACHALTAVQLPDSVTTITKDYGALKYGAFESCTSLTTINIPKSLKTIPDSTFRSCPVLAEIVIPEGVTGIGEEAFRYCYKLLTVTIPKTVTTVGENAFADCTTLGGVDYGDTCAKWDEIDIKDGNEDLTTALIHCTDGWYGVSKYPKIQKVDVEISGQGFIGSYEDLLPLYTANVTAKVQLSLENSWFNDHSDLMTYDLSGYIETFTGTVRIYGYSGAAFKVLYEKQGTAVYDYCTDNDATTSQLVFNMEPSEYTEPFQPDQSLTIEIQDQSGNILARGSCKSLPIQRWSFKNYDATVSEGMIKDILGKSKGKELIKNIDEPLGSGGLCFGMAATASLFNSGELFPTMFPDCTVLDQVQKDTFIYITNMDSASTAQELIQQMQVIQHTEVVQNELDRNYGDFDGLIQAIADYKDGKSAMPVVYLVGKKYTHAICAYDYTVSNGIAYLSYYNIFTVTGTAASRVCFRIVAKADRMKRIWSDVHLRGPSRP